MRVHTVAGKYSIRNKMAAKMDPGREYTLDIPKTRGTTCEFKGQKETSGTGECS
jgi:hypothetical protein